MAAVGSSSSSTEVYGPADHLRDPVCHRATVGARSAQTAPGYIFAAPYNGPGASGPMIFDEAGNLVWFDQLPKNMSTEQVRQLLYAAFVDPWWRAMTRSSTLPATGCPWVSTSRARTSTCGVT